MNFRSFCVCAAAACLLAASCGPKEPVVKYQLFYDWTEDHLPDFSQLGEPDLQGVKTNLDLEGLHVGLAVRPHRRAARVHQRQPLRERRRERGDAFVRQFRQIKEKAEQIRLICGKLEKDSTRREDIARILRLTEEIEEL